MGFFDKVGEFFRDKSRDRLCDCLQSMGIDARMAERRHWAEENIECGVYSESLGLIEIPEGHIRWVNLIKRTVAAETRYYSKYGVPDSRLAPNTHKLQIKTAIKKGDLQWKGNDLGLGLISRLNNDISLKYPLVEGKVDVTVRAYAQPAFWVISTDMRSFPSKELWSCYQSIAQHLLTKWSPNHRFE